MYHDQTRIDLEHEYDERLAVLQKEEYEARAELEQTSNHTKYSSIIMAIEQQRREIEFHRLTLRPTVNVEHAAAEPPLQWEPPFHAESYTSLTIAYRASCTLYPDGRIDLSTKFAGGHGDPGGGLGPIPFRELDRLFRDAITIAHARWGRLWGYDPELIKEIARVDPSFVRGTGAWETNEEQWRKPMADKLAFAPETTRYIRERFPTAEAAGPAPAQVVPFDPSPAAQARAKRFGMTVQEALRDDITVSREDAFELLRECGYTKMQIQSICLYLNARGEKVEDLVKRAIIHIRTRLVESGTL